MRLSKLELELGREAKRLRIKSQSWKEWALECMWYFARRQIDEDAAAWEMKLIGSPGLGDPRCVRVRFGWWDDVCRVELSRRGQGFPIRLIGRNVVSVHHYNKWVSMWFADRQRYEREIRPLLRRIHPEVMWGEVVVRYEYDPSSDSVVMVAGNVPYRLWWAARCGVNVWRIIAPDEGGDDFDVVDGGPLRFGTAVCALGRAVVRWFALPLECSFGVTAAWLGLSERELVNLIRLEAEDPQTAHAAMIL